MHKHDHLKTNIILLRRKTKNGQTWLPIDQHQAAGTRPNRQRSCWHYDLLPMTTTKKKSDSTSQTILPLDSIKYDKFCNVVHQVVGFIVNQLFDLIHFVPFVFSFAFLLLRYVQRSRGIWNAMKNMCSPWSLTNPIMFTNLVTTVTIETEGCGKKYC